MCVCARALISVCICDMFVWVCLCVSVCASLCKSKSLTFKYLKNKNENSTMLKLLSNACSLKISKFRQATKVILLNLSQKTTKPCRCRHFGHRAITENYCFGPLSTIR